MDLSDNFEQSRIKQLLEQFELNGQVAFRIVFGTLGEEASMDYSSWSISDSDYTRCKDSGFQYLMLHLLDIFIEYRSQCESSTDHHAVINVEFSEISIDWVDKKTADKVIADFKNKTGDDNV